MFPDLCSHSVVKLHKATQMFMVIDCVRTMIVKKSGNLGHMDRLIICSFCLTQFLTDQDEIWYGVEAIQGEHPNSIFEWEIMQQGKSLLFYRPCQKPQALACILTFMTRFASNLVW